MKIWLLAFLLALPAWAAPSADTIFTRARAINPGMNDSVSDVGIRMNATLGFMPYRPALSGRSYYKRPDKFKLDLDNAPSYMRKFPSVFAFKLPDLTRYNVLRVQELAWKGQPVYKVMLSPKSPGNITSIDVYINRTDYTVPKFDTFYTQGHLYLEVAFRKEDGFLVPDRLDGDYETASITATAQALYTNYRFNQGLSDEMFQAKKGE